MQIGGGEQSIRVLGEARTARALGDAQIMLHGGRYARLSDLADVKDSVAEIRSLARLNARPATMFSVYKAKGTSDVNVLAAVQREPAPDQADRKPRRHGWRGGRGRKRRGLRRGSGRHCLCQLAGGAVHASASAERGFERILEAQDLAA